MYDMTFRLITYHACQIVTAANHQIGDTKISPWPLWSGLLLMDLVAQVMRRVYYALLWKMQKDLQSVYSILYRFQSIWKVSAQAPWAIYSKLHLRLLIPIKNLAIHCKSMKEVKHLVGGSQTNEKATMKHQRN